MIRRIVLALMVAILMTAVLSACGAPEAEPTTAPAPTNTPIPATATPAPATNTPVPPTDTPVSPTDTPAPEKSTEAEPTKPAATESGVSAKPKWSPKDLFAQSEIKSYRSTLDFTVSGPAFEAEQNMTFVIRGEYTKDPEAQHMVIDAGEEFSMEMVQIGDRSWINFGGTWMETSSDDTGDITDELMIFNVEDIGDLDDFEKVGTDTINGFKTIHYRFDQETLFKALADPEDLVGLEGLKTATGDIWVTDDGVVMKWAMHFEGTGFDTENVEAEGTMDMTYELYDINAADISIQPPEAPSTAESLGFELPVPEGATQTMAMEGLITFDVVDRTIEELTDFYKTEFARLGFTFDAEQSLVSAEYVALTFSNGTIDLDVSIFPGDEGKLQVMIMTGG